MNELTEEQQAFLDKANALWDEFDRADAEKQVMGHTNGEDWYDGRCVVCVQEWMSLTQQQMHGEARFDEWLDGKQCRKQE